MNEELNSQKQNRGTIEIDKMKNITDRKFVSFNEQDKDGKIIETYGYFEPVENNTIDERVEDLKNRFIR